MANGNLDYTKNIALAISYCFAILTVILGVSVIIGWHAHLLPLIRYQVNTIAMVYNTALSFISVGLAIILIYKFKPNIAIGLIVLVMIVATASLFQHVLAVDLGIDQFFFQHYEQTANTYPGRMAPNTSVCFILSGIAILLLQVNRCRKLYLGFSIAIGVFVFCLSCVFVGGYETNLYAIYTWGTITPIAKNTALGFCLLSIAIVSLATFTAIADNVDIKKFIPFFVTLAMIFAVIILSAEVQGDNGAGNSTLGTVVFMLGLIFSVLFGLLLFFLLSAIYSARETKKHLSLIRATLESSAEGVVAIGNDGQINEYNEKFLQMWKISTCQIKKMDRKTLNNYISEHILNKDEYLRKMREIAQDDQLEMVQELKLKDGGIYNVYVKPQVLDGKSIGRVWVYMDVTVHKRLENQLMHLSTYDVLTGLPNRALILDLLSRSIQTAKSVNKNLVVLLMDVDRFSQINDTFGRSKGDMLLKSISIKLKKCLPPTATIGRLGGDEFLVIVDDLVKTDNITFVLNKILKIFDVPFGFYEHEIKTSICIGVVFFPKDGQEADVLLSNVDVAMLRAKKEGRNCFQFYTQDMNAYSMQNIKMQTEIHKAFEDNQFIVYYQPIIDLDTNLVVGAEALVRWHYPEQGLLFPDSFISTIEELGLMNKLTETVLFDACNSAAEWHEQGCKIQIAVNISASQLNGDWICRIIDNALAQSDLDPKFLTIELTEGLLIDSGRQVRNTLDALKTKGITLAVDDFGTGYSSLSYLKNLSVDELKIDRAFICDMTENKENQALIKAIIVMGKSLNLKLVAEGIETAAQLDLLKEYECDYGQGYYYSEALPQDKMLQFLIKHTKN